MPLRELAKAPVATAVAADAALALPLAGVRISFGANWHEFLRTGDAAARATIEPLSAALMRGEAVLRDRYERGYDGAQHG